MANKQKTNTKNDPNSSNKKDRCQTPDYALDALLPFITQFQTIWEPASGEGYLVKAIRAALPLVNMITGDILYGQNFFEYVPLFFDLLLTNPPFSGKYHWLTRAYQLGKPFALLVPVDTMGAATAQRLIDKHGAELIYMDKRINYKMPDMGWKGKGSKFASMWITYGLGIQQQTGKSTVFAKIKPRPQLDSIESPMPLPTSVQLSFLDLEVSA